MTDTLKTVLSDALDDAGINTHYHHRWQDDPSKVTFDGNIDLDRLATAVRDYFLDREKVRAALIAAIGKSAHNADHDYHTEAEAYFDEETNLISIGGGCDDFYAPKFRADDLVTALIAGLAGGSSE